MRSGDEELPQALHDPVSITMNKMEFLDCIEGSPSSDFRGNV